MNTFIFLSIVAIVLIVFKIRNPLDTRAPKKQVQINEKIKLYGRETCGFTVKMLKIIAKAKKTHMFEYIDVSTPEGKKEFSKVSEADGVPAFVYKSKVVVGAMALDDLFEKLNVA